MKLFLAILPFLSSATLFAQGNEKAPGREGNMMQTLIMIGIAVLFFYFILWRPEKKRRKALENLRSSMKKGDRVTAMGIIGTIDKIEEKSVILKMVDGSKIEVIKGSISEVQPTGEVTVETEKSPSK